MAVTENEAKSFYTCEIYIASIIEGLSNGQWFLNGFFSLYDCKSQIKEQEAEMMLCLSAVAL